MIRILGSVAGEAISGVVLVAFDRETGQVHATSGHGIVAKVEDAEIARDRQRLITELRARLGESAEIDVVEVPLSELQHGWVDRVEPATRKVIVRRKNGAS